MSLGWHLQGKQLLSTQMEEMRQQMIVMLNKLTEPFQIEQNGTESDDQWTKQGLVFIKRKRKAVLWCQLKKTKTRSVHKEGPLWAVVWLS